MGLAKREIFFKKNMGYIESISEIFSIICHQKADRSFLNINGQIILCSRCTGLYAGLLLFLIIKPIKFLVNNILVTYIIFIFIVGLSIISVNSNIYDTNTERFILGLVLGIVLSNIFKYAFIYK